MVDYIKLTKGSYDLRVLFFVCKVYSNKMHKVTNAPPFVWLEGVHSHHC